MMLPGTSVSATGAGNSRVGVPVTVSREIAAAAVHPVHWRCTPELTLAQVKLPLDRGHLETGT
jgi:hypothetical protein